MDLTQYAAMRIQEDSVENADSNALAAFFFGGSFGALLGRPSSPVVLAAFGGYAPWLRFEETQGRGAYRFGVFVGTDLPFMDFN